MNKLQIQLDQIRFYWEFERDDGVFSGGMAYIVLPDSMCETLITACADSIRKTLGIDGAFAIEVADGKTF